MPLTDSATKVTYTGDGTTEVFNITFDFTDKDELKVYLRDESVTPATETLQTEVTHYTVLGVDIPNGVPGTDIDMVTAPTASQKLIIKRVLPLEQNLSMDNGQATSMEAFETELNKIVMQIQQLQEQLNRTAKLPETTPLSSLSVTEPAAGEFLRWNDDEDGVESSGVADLADLPAVVTSPTSGQVLGYNGTGWVNTAPTYSFRTLSVPSGTSPVADSATDTLTFTTDGTILVSGNSTTDTIDFSLNAGQIVDSHISNSANISRSKLGVSGALQRGHVLINDPTTGAFSSEASLDVTRGGTGAATLTAKSLLVGNGTSAVAFLAPSATANTSVVSNGTDFAAGPVITSGVYTPSIATGTNVTAASSGGGQYLRIGSHVQAGILLNITTTAAANTASDVEVTLPISSDFTSTGDAVGIVSVASSGTEVNPGTVSAHVANNRLLLSWNSVVVGAANYYIQVTYRIR